MRLADPAIVPIDPADATPTQHGRWLLAQLLGWHRREDKAMWWEFHRLMDLTPEQLVEEDAPIGGLVPVGPVDEETRGKQTWRYAFPDQELRPRPTATVRPAPKAGRRPDAQSVQLGRRRDRRPSIQASLTIDIRARPSTSRIRVRSSR